MHLGCAVWKCVSSRSFEVVCFGMPRGLCREWGDGQKGAAARVVNDSIPALMAASCGRSMTQFAVGFQQCDQNDGRKSVQTWMCLTGMFRSVLMAVSINRAGSIKCPFAPSIISLAPRRLLVYSQQHAPGPRLTLSANSVWLCRAYQSHLRLHLERQRHLAYARRFTADMSSVRSTAFFSRTSVLPQKV